MTSLLQQWNESQDSSNIPLCGVTLTTICPLSHGNNKRMQEVMERIVFMLFALMTSLNVMSQEFMGISLNQSVANFEKELFGRGYSKVKEYDDRTLYRGDADYVYILKGEMDNEKVYCVISSVPVVRRKSDAVAVLNQRKNEILDKYDGETFEVALENGFMTLTLDNETSHILVSVDSSREDMYLVNVLFKNRLAY
jgi:hypothetical protein